jgi:hypothetical protein
MNFFIIFLYFFIFNLYSMDEEYIYPEYDEEILGIMYENKPLYKLFRDKNISSKFKCVFYREDEEDKVIGSIVYYHDSSYDSDSICISNEAYRDLSGEFVIKSFFNIIDEMIHPTIVYFNTREEKGGSMCVFNKNFKLVETTKDKKGKKYRFEYKNNAYLKKTSNLLK